MIKDFINFDWHIYAIIIASEMVDEQSARERLIPWNLSCFIIVLFPLFRPKDILINKMISYSLIEFSLSDLDRIIQPAQFLINKGLNTCSGDIVPC